MASPDGPLRVLSLDGGGIRGLSEIMILKIIMEEVNEARKKRGEPVVQPYEYFDMIGGTSTGGIIAVMLGRLHMTLGQCEKAYTTLGQKIFEPKYTGLNPRRGIDCLMANGKLDSSILEAAIKEIIAENSEGGAEEANNAMLMEEDAKCKVLVCALDSRNANPIFLRNFRSQKADLISRDIKIWEACRATSAATTFFDPFFFEKRQMSFVDGAPMYNNPVRRVHEEAGQLWPERRDRMVLISIGTGDSPRIKLEGNLVKIAKKLAELVTDTQQVADDFTFEHPEIARNRYFRFNATDMEDIGLEEYKEIGGIFRETQTYLQGAIIRLEIKACVQTLRLSGKEMSRLTPPPYPSKHPEREQVAPEPIDRQTLDETFGEEATNDSKLAQRAEKDELRNFQARPESNVQAPYQLLSESSELRDMARNEIVCLNKESLWNSSSEAEEKAQVERQMREGEGRQIQLPEEASPNVEIDVLSLSEEASNSRNFLMSRFKQLAAAILLSSGYLEPECDPGHHRVRWTCRCGRHFYHDFVEISPGGLDMLKDQLKRSGATVLSNNTQDSRKTRGVFSSISLLWTDYFPLRHSNEDRGETERESDLELNAQTPRREAPEPATLTKHILSCTHSGKHGKVLHQDLIENVSSDRTLFEFLRECLQKNRGRVRTATSLRAVRGIKFVKVSRLKSFVGNILTSAQFILRGGPDVEILHHGQFCRKSCNCLPPKRYVRPRGAIYECQPVPVTWHPPIAPDYLMHRFENPSCVHQDETVTFDQIPKRICGRLEPNARIKQMGWGILFEEGWNTQRIAAILLLVFFASLIFGVSWSLSRHDVSGAFTVAAWIFSTCAILLGFFALQEEAF